MYKNRFSWKKLILSFKIRYWFIKCERSIFCLVRFLVQALLCLYGQDSGGGQERTCSVEPQVGIDSQFVTRRTASRVSASRVSRWDTPEVAHLSMPFHTDAWSSVLVSPVWAAFGSIGYIVWTAAVRCSFYFIKKGINVTALGRILNVNLNPLNKAPG